MFRTGLVAFFTCALPLVAAEKTEKITYQEHVQPIFRQHCSSCHNTDKKTADLDLLNYTAMMQGGGSGAVIEPGDASNSYLFMLVNHDSDPKMPPSQPKIEVAKLDLIRQWIDGGALENAGSAPAKMKPKFDLSLAANPSGRPEGPPPMPETLGIDPVIHTAQTTAVTALATNPWSPLVAIGGQKQIILYNTKTLDLVGVLPFPEGVPQILKFSPNGALLLAGGGHDAERGRVIVWNVRTGERVIEVGDELDTVLAADISADQSMVALGGPGRVVKVFSTATGELKYELKKHTDWIYSIAFSPDGVLLTTGDRNGGLLVWEAGTGREYLTLNGHKAAITDLSWRGDSNVLASSSEDGGIRLWEMTEGKNVKTWTAHGGGAASVEFARDGRLVSCGRDKVTKLWDQNGAQQRAFPAFTDIALQASICDETNQVIAGDWTGAIRVWAAADGKPIGELTANPLMLDDQLVQANQAFAAKQAAHKPLAEAATAAQAALVKVQTDLAAAAKTVTDLDAKTKALPGEMAKIKLTIDTLTKEIEAAKPAVVNLEAVVVPLQEALTKSQLALEKVKDDQALAAAVAQLKAQVDAKQAALAAAKKVQTDKTAAQQQQQAAFVAAEKLLAESQAGLVAAQKTVAALQPTVKPAQDKAAQTKAAADAAAAQVAAAQQEVARLQVEVQFREKQKAVAALEAKANELTAAAQQAADAVKKTEGDLATANQTVAAATKQVETTNTAVTQAKQTVTTATAALAATNQSVTTLTGLLPALQATLKSAEETAAKSAGDKEVAAAVAAWKTLLAAKTTGLEAAKKAVPEQTAALEAAKTAQTAAELVAVKAATDLAAAQKLAADLTAALKPLQEKAVAALAAAAAATQTVEAGKKELEQIKKTTKPAPEVAQTKAA